MCTTSYFADAPARVRPNGDLIYRYGKRVEDAQMMAHGAFAAFFSDAAGLPAARVKEGSGQWLYFASQDGHNAESHNHNDVGNFMVYANGLPAIIDVGGETYRAKTFSSKRYEIWTMQSAYHNCPTIDGVMQSAGRQFAASEVSCRADDASAEFPLNIASAYPKEANLEAWRRTLRLDRARNQIGLTDDYALKQPVKVITLTLMTCCAVTQEAPGRLSLAVASGNALKVLYDARTFTPLIEEIRIDDARCAQRGQRGSFRVDRLAKKEFRFC